MLHKIGTELRWEYRWDEPMHPWRVEDPGGRLRIELQPRFDKHSKIEVGVMGTETHQAFGRWSGTFVTDGGGSIELNAFQGFAEEPVRVGKCQPPEALAEPLHIIGPRPMLESALSAGTEAS